MNMKTVSVILLFGCLFLGAKSAPIDNIFAVLASIPEAERVEFIKYHLKVGHDLVNGKNQNVWLTELPENFSETLYEYISQKYMIKNKSVRDFLREVVCFEDGSCIDVGDIGVHP